MVPGHCSNCRVMGLLNGLKIKSLSIPEGEFTRGSPGNESAAFRGPFDNVDGAADFVGGSVGEMHAEG